LLANPFDISTSSSPKVNPEDFLGMEEGDLLSEITGMIKNFPQINIAEDGTFNAIYDTWKQILAIFKDSCGN
jgi:hypothetical protein